MRIFLKFFFIFFRQFLFKFFLTNFVLNAVFLLVFLANVLLTVSVIIIVFVYNGLKECLIEMSKHCLAMLCSLISISFLFKRFTFYLIFWSLCCGGQIGM